MPNKKIKIYPKWWRENQGEWEFLDPVEDEDFIYMYRIPSIMIDINVMKEYEEAKAHYLKMCEVIRKELDGQADR